MVLYATEFSENVFKLKKKKRIEKMGYWMKKTE